MSAIKQKHDLESVKADWAIYVTHLFGQLEHWLRANPHHPTITSKDVTIEERNIGQYHAPVLEADFGEELGAIMFETSARNYPGRGFITVTSWPTLRRVFLTQDSASNDPIVYTEYRIPLHQDWSQANFDRLLDDLLAQS